MKQKLLEIIKVTVHSVNLFLFCFTKTRMGAKTALRAPKLSYFNGGRHNLVPGLTTECQLPAI